MSNSPVIVCEDLQKSFGAGNTQQRVLSGVNLSVRAGESLVISGSSGSGKTTLLHLLGGLDEPDNGDISTGGRNWKSMSKAQAAVWRNRMLGFVFQLHLLLPEFSAEENVAMPLFIRGEPRKQALEQARACLQQLNMESHAGKTPDKLSGGERQRVAVARALAGKPSCILADEPTGNLDRKNAETVFELMLNAASSQNTALIVVSHDPLLAARAGRRAALTDGKLEEQS